MPKQSFSELALFQHSLYNLIIMHESANEKDTIVSVASSCTDGFYHLMLCHEDEVYFHSQRSDFYRWMFTKFIITTSKPVIQSIQSQSRVSWKEVPVFFPLCVWRVFDKEGWFQGTVTEKSLH